MYFFSKMQVNLRPRFCVAMVLAASIILYVLNVNGDSSALFPFPHAAHALSCNNQIISAAITSTDYVNDYRRCTVAASHTISIGASSAISAAANTVGGRRSVSVMFVESLMSTDETVLTVEGLLPAAFASTAALEAVRALTCPTHVRIAHSTFSNAAVRLRGYFPPSSTIHIHNNTFKTAKAFLGMSVLYPTAQYTASFFLIGLYLTKQSLLTIIGNRATLTSILAGPGYCIWLHSESALMLTTKTVFVIAENNVSCSGTAPLSDNYFVHYRNMATTFQITDGSQHFISNNTYVSKATNRATTRYRNARGITPFDTPIFVTGSGSGLYWSGNRFTAYDFTYSALLFGHGQNLGATMPEAELFLSNEARFECSGNTVYITESSSTTYASFLGFKTLQLGGGVLPATAYISANVALLAVGSPTTPVAAVEIITLTLASGGNRLLMSGNALATDTTNSDACLRLDTVSVGASGGTGVLLAGWTCTNAVVAETRLVSVSGTSTAGALSFCAGNAVGGATLATLTDYSGPPTERVSPVETIGTFYGAGSCPAMAAVSMASTAFDAAVKSAAAAVAFPVSPMRQCQTHSVTQQSPSESPRVWSRSATNKDASMSTTHTPGAPTVTLSSPPSNTALKTTTSATTKTATATTFLWRASSSPTSLLTPTATRSVSPSPTTTSFLWSPTASPHSHSYTATDDSTAVIPTITPTTAAPSLTTTSPTTGPATGPTTGPATDPATGPTTGPVTDPATDPTTDPPTGPATISPTDPCSVPLEVPTVTLTQTEEEQASAPTDAVVIFWYAAAVLYVSAGSLPFQPLLEIHSPNAAYDTVPNVTCTVTSTAAIACRGWAGLFPPVGAGAATATRVVTLSMGPQQVDCSQVAVRAILVLVSSRGGTWVASAAVVRVAAAASEAAAQVLLLADPTAAEHHIPAQLLLAPCADPFSRSTATASRYLLVPGIALGAGGAVWVQAALALLAVALHAGILRAVRRSWGVPPGLGLHAASLAVPGLAWAAGMLISGIGSDSPDDTALAGAVIVLTAAAVGVGAAPALTLRARRLNYALTPSRSDSSLWERFVSPGGVWAGTERDAARGRWALLAAHPWTIVAGPRGAYHGLTAVLLSVAVCAATAGPGAVEGSSAPTASCRARQIAAASLIVIYAGGSAVLRPFRAPATLALALVNLVGAALIASGQAAATPVVVAAGAIFASAASWSRLAHTVWAITSDVRLAATKNDAALFDGGDGGMGEEMLVVHNV